MNPKIDVNPGTDRTCEMPERFFHDIKIEFLIHELKTPMALVETAIRALLEARQIYGELNPKQEKALQRALRNTDKIRSMVYNLLEIGRSEAGCFFCHSFDPVLAAEEELADVTEAVRWGDPKKGAADPSAKIDWAQYHIRVCVAADAKDLQMRQDEVKYRQIIANLVKNALHHRRLWMEMRLAVKADRFYLEISDDGPGIATEHQEVIFQRYAQIDGTSGLARKGHGLGLAGARILARCLGGDVRIESEINRGANFIVDLPMQLPAAEQ